MLRNPHIRFLLRTLAWLAVALALWGMILIDPLLGGLRIATALTLRLLPGDGSVAHASPAPDGSWLVQMPVPASVARLESTQRIFGRVSKDAPLVKVRSLKITIPGKFPVLFTVSLPFFWALWAAAPGHGSILRLLAGSVALAIIGVCSLVFFAIYTAASTLGLISPGIWESLVKTAYFGVVGVLPYAAPPLLALVFHEGLQALVFSGQALPLEPGKAEPKAGRAGRGRYRVKR